MNKEISLVDESETEQPQSDVRTPHPVTLEAGNRPSRKGTSSALNQDRLERLWQAIEQAGEYAQPDGGINQCIPGMSNGGAA